MGGGKAIMKRGRRGTKNEERRRRKKEERTHLRSQKEL
jgi:hypothetical protein